jgi:hypothetical protein
MMGGGMLRQEFDADARAWAANVLTNSGTYSTATLVAVSNFCRSAKAAGIWSKLTRVNLFAGDQLAAALAPLKVGGGNATDTNVNFVSGDYTEATGLTGNGSTKYLDSGLQASALTLNDTHLAFYNRASVANGNVHMGARDGSFNGVFLAAPLAADQKVYSDIYSGAGGGRLASASAIGTPYGFIVGSRTAANLHTIYRNGSSIGSNTTTNGSLPALNIYVVGGNANGTALYTSNPAGAYSIGSGLTAGEVASYATIMEAFQDALNRGVA